ncbi:conserved hypothetical protein [Pseudomonas savastanoi pv. phaseolicola 1448A]|uniref:Uncharacterized protein n=1 Tax=Pseudomonas savastanoi pv. phaseolicola (strain 1448A / Race 6) TaxID=264730 RepID=Q48EA8_PSE14|nr:conserved hypothetical protein [Pseudomonas savastanoi pv. phaseolicola 1448A]
MSTPSEESAEYLCAVLLRTMQDQRLPPALREAALRHSSKTYAELLSFISEHGEYETVRNFVFGHNM